MEKKYGSSWKNTVSSSIKTVRHNQNLKPQLAVALVLVLVVGTVVYFQGGRSAQDQISLADESVSVLGEDVVSTQAATSTTLAINPLSQPTGTLVESTTTTGEESASTEISKQKPVGYPPSPKRTQCQSYYGASVANVAFAQMTENEETTTTEAQTTTTEAETTTTAKPTTTQAPTTSEPTTTKAPTTKAPTTTARPTTTQAPATTAAPTTAQPATTNPHPSGWVNAGHNVYVPKVLIVIRCCESTGNYTAANAHSTARGAYQFLTGSWAYYGHKDRYGASQAHLASPAQQDEAALKTWERDGTRPWNASKACWGQNPV